MPREMDIDMRAETEDLIPFSDEVPVEDTLGDEQDETISFKYAITSYGADYPVDGLVKRIQDGNIYIPSFQRGYVWNATRASRFVESLLLGLPVPGIFLSKEQDTGKLLVIDGQQRLRTLQYFYEGSWGSKVFALRGVQSQFKGAAYKTLGDEDRRRLDDSILHATVIKQDHPSEDDSSIYYIFERLNTGGVQLQPQEIRACIYHGEFAEWLREANQEPSWRAMFGSIHPRMRDQELILRALALFLCEKYEKPMKEFLNTFMGRNRHLNGEITRDRLSRTFVPTVNAIYEALGSSAFKPRRSLNAAVVDSVFVGVAKRLEQGLIAQPLQLRAAYDGLVMNSDYLSTVETSTADEDNVRKRTSAAISAFSSVP